MSNSKSYDRQPEETDIMFDGFVIYRNLGPLRSLTAAYQIYCDRSQKSRAKSKKVPNQPGGHFRRWSSDNNWPDRARDWDKDEEERLRKVLVEHDEKNYIKEIGEFRKLQVESGKLGVQIALKIKSDVAVYLGMAQKNKQTHPIANLREAEQMARILNMVEGKSSDQWSRGLLLNELIAELEGGSDRS